MNRSRPLLESVFLGKVCLICHSPGRVRNVERGQDVAASSKVWEVGHERTGIARRGYLGSCVVDAMLGAAWS